MSHIVQADHSHVEIVSALFDAYRVFYEQASDKDGARQFIAARIAAQESVIFLALNEDGEGVGFTQLYPSFTSVGMQRIWVLNDLYVAKAARKTGVAWALMEAAHAHARATGAKRVELATAPDNYAAQALYDKLGYSQDDFFHYSFAV